MLRLGLDAAQPAEAGKPSEIPVAAPVAGTVIERTAAPGLAVDKDASLFVVASLRRVWVIADIYEKDLGQIESRGEVEVRSDAYPGAAFKGRLALVEPSLNETARVAHARIVLENPDGRLRPGLFVTAAIPMTGAPGAAIAIPVEALQKINGATAVFVESAPGEYALRPVEAGREGEGKVEITQGLAQGEQVVVAGAFTLKSELLKGTLGGDE
jgi:RND family efflux transporter MFP subunit